MNYIVKKWNNKEYLEYKTNNKEVFDNLHYFYVDIKSEDFRNIANSYDTETTDAAIFGRYIFNVTIRYVKRNKLNTCQYIYFIPIPQKTNNFVFVIAYVSSDNKLLAKEYANNISDYLYFTRKLNKVAKQGIIWELNGLDEIKSKFSDKVSTSYGVKIDGKEITEKDVLESDDFSIFSEDFLQQFKDYELLSYDFSIDTDGLTGLCLSLTFNATHGKIMENKIYQHLDSVDDKPYTVTIPFSAISHIKNVKVIGEKN